MPNYLVPGVYVEEQPSAIRPIAGVGTSTAGFVGVIKEAGLTMPDRPDGTAFTLTTADVPVLVDGWETFRTSFGDIQAGNAVLARAVYGFFDNGGSRCWVVRVSTQSAADSPPISATGLAGALTAFEAIDEIALVAVPGETSKDLQDRVVAHCEKMQDRFAILDGVRNPGTVTAANVRTAGASKDGYGAVYFPWIDIGADDAGARIVAPPSGHVAGVYARVDATRGVHKAPANETIRGAVATERPIGRSLQEGLSPNGVNVLRSIGGAVTIWGARTIASNPEWSYVSSRRLMNYLRESIDEGVQWAVFEPNGPELWAMIRRNVRGFLTSTWASGALLGRTADEAFFIRCDESTNTEDDIANGRLVAVIGVSLVRPAEFVVFRISQWAGPAS